MRSHSALDLIMVGIVLGCAFGGLTGSLLLGDQHIPGMYFGTDFGAGAGALLYIALNYRF